MKIRIYSDLHTEFEAFTPPAIDADLVILAGDIGTKSRGVRWANETFSCPVVYVCGNHEFYGGHIDRTLEKMKTAAAPHVHILENESWVWNQTRFLGATCWTDFTSTGNVSAATRKAAEWMNDFSAIRADASYRRLHPSDVAGRNGVSRAWLAQELNRPFQGKTVVVTHHAPVTEALRDKHEGHLASAYANHWPELIENADLWIFGHTHRSIDTVLAGCRVVSNPRGYPGESTGFRADLGIDI